MGRRREEVKALRREEFQWRCAYGRHAYPSRTRELRHKRPMVLYWRRYGRVGGCWINKKEKRKTEEFFNGGLAQLGEHLPCKQGVESSNLLVSIRNDSI